MTEKVRNEPEQNTRVYEPLKVRLQGELDRTASNFPASLAIASNPT